MLHHNEHNNLVVCCCWPAMETNMMEGACCTTMSTRSWCCVAAVDAGMLVFHSMSGHQCPQIAPAPLTLMGSGRVMR